MSLRRTSNWNRDWHRIMPQEPIEDEGGARERSEREGPTGKPRFHRHLAGHFRWPGVRYDRVDGVIKTLVQVPSFTFEELRSTSSPFASA